MLSEVISKSEINLVIKGKGTQYLLSSNFYKDPSEVLVNGELDTSCKKTCNLNGDINNITLIFNENLNSCANMFNGRSNILEIDLSNFDSSNVTSMNRMFYQCSILQKIKFGNIKTSSVKDMSETFHYCYKLLYIDLTNFDTSSVTTMYQMFRHCDTVIYIDASSFITTKVENMEDLFSECGNLVAVNVLSFDTSNVKKMNGMFSACKNIKFVNLVNFSGNSVINMNHMFFDCSSLKILNFKSINIINSAEMNWMFDSVSNNLKYCTSDSKLKSRLSGKQLVCSDSCFINNYKYNVETNICQQSCTNYQFKNLCYNDCPGNTYRFINKKCSEILPENYYLDNNDKIYKECYQSCKKCNKAGNETYNNCDECKEGLIFLNEDFIDRQNCFQKCTGYYYFNKNDEYNCTESCPSEYDKLIPEKQINSRKTKMY